MARGEERGVVVTCGKGQGKSGQGKVAREKNEALHFYLWFFLAPRH